MKLRTRFFLIFSILAVIPLLILTEYSYVRYRDITYERMDELSENLFQNAFHEFFLLLIMTNDRASIAERGGAIVAALS